MIAVDLCREPYSTAGYGIGITIVEEEEEDFLSQCFVLQSATLYSPLTYLMVAGVRQLEYSDYKT